MDHLKTKCAVGIAISITLATLICLATARSSVAAEDETGKKILLDKEPKGAMDVLAARKDAKDQQEIVVVGRIGGRTNPWVKGVAAFPIVDRMLRPCNEIEGDSCKTPWDYCCEPNLAEATLLVLLVDDKGQVIKKDPRTLLGVKELQTVVVKGKTKRDKAGNVTVYASQLHIRPNKPVNE